MENFSKQIAWQNFFAVKVAQAEIEEAEAESKLKRIEAEAQFKSSATKVTDARLERDMDPEVNEARDTYLVAKARRKMLEVTMGNRDRCANLLSRELTRRVGGTPKRSHWSP